MRTALIIGAGAVAAYLLLFRSALAAPTPAYPSASAGFPAAQPYGAPPPATAVSSVGKIANTINTLNNAGCVAIASSKIPGGAAKLGCSLNNYLNPINVTATVIKDIPKIPIVGKPVAAVGGAISGAASSAYHSIANIF